MNRCLASGAAALSALSLLLFARSSLADGPLAANNAVYVLTIRTDDADDQADAMTRALRARVKQTAGWSLLETNQSFETLAIALKCPAKPDPACLLRIGDQLHANRYIWGTMERRKGPPGQVSADMHMWSRGKVGAEARGAFSDTVKDPGDEGLQLLAADLFNQLGGQPVALAAPAPVGPAAPLPAGHATPPPPPAAPAPESGDIISVGHIEPESKFTARTALAYSTLVLGAGFIAGAIVEAASWVSDSNASTTDRQNVPVSVVDVCSSTSAPAVDACSKSNDAMKASTLGWIFAGIGAGLVATGVSLIVTEHSARPRADEASAATKTRVDVLPSVGPRSGAVGVRVTF